ncbi:MAG TPA: toll/interleukin-1 receptor domain-containing protein [Terriglobales bacterium]|nr:toll/interleukin-1 receptor domain-containing protein [Terriglobales bacterium]
MPFKVFLSYGTDPESQITAWRLQTLGTSYGIEISVPQRNGAYSSGSRATLTQIQRAIDEADCVLAIVTGPSGPAVERELNYALQKRKVIVPIVQQGVVSQDFLAMFPQTIQLSPSQDPEQLSQIMDFLKRQKLSKENQKALGALVLAGLGLLFLWTVAEK